MTQPAKPASDRGTRPELFGAARAPRSQQSDFGPSILATIDGSPRRAQRVREGMPLKRVLLMALLALGVVAVYFGVKLGTSQSVAMPEVAQAQPQESTPVAVALAKPAEPAAAASSVAAMGQAASATGAASIENVAAPVPQPAASDPGSARNVATSLTGIQQVLDRSGARPPHAPQGRVSPTKEAVALRSAAPAPAKAATKPGSDSDAELLAAMLPHLKRRGSAPTSPAYEQRCGQFSGNAVLECRAKFCTGREGVDLACPTSKTP